LNQRCVTCTCPGIPGYSHSWFVPENRELGFKGFFYQSQDSWSCLPHLMLQWKVIMSFQSGILEKVPGSIPRPIPPGTPVSSYITLQITQYCLCTTMLMLNSWFIIKIKFRIYFF
jgi:hypothetical protein